MVRLDRRDHIKAEAKDEILYMTMMRGIKAEIYIAKSEIDARTRGIEAMRGMIIHVCRVDRAIFVYI